MSGMINKVKNVVHEATHPKDDTASAPGTNPSLPEGTAGPHSSRISNAAHPRVDADLDRHEIGAVSPTGAIPSEPHVGHAEPPVSGVSGATDAGLQNSKMANKLDPRVDSDLGGSHNVGVNQTTGPTDHPPAVSATGTGAEVGSASSTNAGPHDSKILNKLDPRVDSNINDNRNMGSEQKTSLPGPVCTIGATSTESGLGSTRSTAAGPHDKAIADTLDSRVVSDLDGHRNVGLNQNTVQTTTLDATHDEVIGATSSTNAGPHKNNISNKLDPRVDSDLDGSRNAGMNQTTRGTGP